MQRRYDRAQIADRNDRKEGRSWPRKPTASRKRSKANYGCWSPLPDRWGNDSRAPARRRFATHRRAASRSTASCNRASRPSGAPPASRWRTCTARTGGTVRHPSRSGAPTRWPVRGPRRTPRRFVPNSGCVTRCAHGTASRSTTPGPTRRRYASASGSNWIAPSATARAGMQNGDAPRPSRPRHSGSSRRPTRRTACRGGQGSGRARAGPRGAGTRGRRGRAARSDGGPGTGGRAHPVRQRRAARGHRTRPRSQGHQPGGGGHQDARRRQPGQAGDRGRQGRCRGSHTQGSENSRTGRAGAAHRARSVTAGRHAQQRGTATPRGAVPLVSGGQCASSTGGSSVSSRTSGNMPSGGAT